MNNLDQVQINNGKIFIYITLFLVAFLAGLLNSEVYFIFLGLNLFNSMIQLCFYLLVFLFIFILLINNLLTRKKIFPDTYQYWIILLFAIGLKFFILFIQDPTWLFPGGKYFSDLFHFSLILIIMILFSGIISDFQRVKIAIWGLGIGASFSTLIPMILFPEMIGSRDLYVGNYYFSGGFWNSAVISYISVGWLIIALSNIEKSYLKRIFLISLFFIIAFGGIAGLSRATLLSVIVSSLAYVTFANKFKKYIKVIISGIIIFLLVINLFPELFSNFSDRLEGGIDIENESRTTIWLDYLEDLPSYFLFGAIDGDYTKYSMNQMGPHSTVLNWLSQFGLLGLIGFLILIIGLIVSIKNVRRQFKNETSSALYAWVVAYLSVALINQTGFKQLTVFVGFGIILAWGNISKKMTDGKLNNTKKYKN